MEICIKYKFGRQAEQIGGAAAAAAFKCKVAESGCTCPLC